MAAKSYPYRMGVMSIVRHELLGEAATLALGAVLGRELHAGDRVYLYGPLGAGKTTLVRGIMAGLNHPDPREVASPTFALHHRYEGGRLPVDHLDLYRLVAPVNLATEGMDAVVQDPSSVLIVEWPERLEDGLFVPDLVVELGLLHEGARSLSLKCRQGRESISESLGIPR